MIQDDTTQLLRDLNARTTDVRLQAIRALGQRRAAKALKELIRCLADPEVAVQAAAATALGQIGEAQAVPALLNMFAGNTYRRINREGSPARYFAIVGSAAEALGKIGTPPAIDALLTGVTLKSPLSIERTAAAALGLGHVRDKRAVSALLVALRHPDHFVRCQAATALGQQGHVRAVPALIKALRDAAWPVQVAAAEALGNLRHPAAVEPLQHLLQPLAKPSDVQFRLQAQAARGLGLIGTPAALNTLDAAFQSSHIAEQAVGAIGLAYRQDARAFGVLAQALSAERDAIKCAAIAALVSLQDPRAIPLLEAVGARQDIPATTTEAARQAVQQMAAGQ